MSSIFQYYAIIDAKYQQLVSNKKVNIKLLFS